MPPEPILTPKRLVAASDPSRLAVAKLHCFAPRSGQPAGFATGVFIAKDLLLTVGHALFDPGLFGPDRLGGYAGRVRISSPWIPAAGSVETDRIVVMDGWIDHFQAERDIGLIRLDAPVPGVTSIELRALSSAQLSALQLRFYGFPIDSHQLFCGDGTCVEALSGKILHNADAGPGESGSPLLARLAGGTAIVGLHRASTAEGSGSHPQAVSAVRITEAVKVWIPQMLEDL